MQNKNGIIFYHAWGHKVYVCIWQGQSSYPSTDFKSEMDLDISFVSCESPENEEPRIMSLKKKESGTSNSLKDEKRSECQNYLPHMCYWSHISSVINFPLSSLPLGIPSPFITSFLLWKLTLLWWISFP